MVPACQSCNSSKHAKPLEKWLEDKGKDMSFEVAEIMILEHYAFSN